MVSGHKIWTSSAQIADWIYLAVRTDPDAARPHRGVSVLVADMRTPGIEVREIETVGGGVLCEVFLERGRGARRTSWSASCTAAGGCSWARSTTSA